MRAASPRYFEVEAVKTLLTAIKGQHTKLEALVEIACHPQVKAHHTQACRDYQIQTLRAIRSLEDQHLAVDYLQRLVPTLQANQRLEIANIIQEDINDAYLSTKALVFLAGSDPRFRPEAQEKVHNLHDLVQHIEQRSLLAVEMPEILPAMLKRLDVEAKKNQEPQQWRNILIALAPHLPMRINREINRKFALGQPITDHLRERALYCLARGYRDALSKGSLRNESAQAEDLLNLKDEVNALSDLLLMRDLEPPMAVGILGGWGGGKSYIMHLMQERMTQIRSRKVDLEPENEAWNVDPNYEKLSPYVGHIYQIKFDAWTFAKSNLWASLMQAIFCELNRQISLEQQLARVFVDDPKDVEDPQAQVDISYERAKILCEEGKYWPVIYRANESDQQWFLEHILSPDQLNKFKKIRNQGQVDNELWRQLGESYREENQKLDQLELELQRKKEN